MTAREGMKPHIRPCRIQHFAGMDLWTLVAAACVRYSCVGRGVTQYGATAKDAYRHWAREAMPWWERWFA